MISMNEPPLYLVHFYNSWAISIDVIGQLKHYYEQ